MPLLVSKVENPSIRAFSPGTFLVYPSIRREDIRWTGGAGREPLRFELIFENRASRPSAPVTARVEVAPFGAFLPWRPLVKVAVPPIPPGGRRVVTETVGGDAPLPPLPATAPGTRLQAGAIQGLAGLLSSRNLPHFVGNLNVYVSGRRPVERHLQRAVGLRPACDNIAVFCVGDGKLDGYTFSVRNCQPGWEASLPGVSWNSAVPISFAYLALSIRPPSTAESGTLSVQVRRESTGQTVDVEFELEAGAVGSRCYVF